jgi:hypothetical protein
MKSKLITAAFTAIMLAPEAAIATTYGNPTVLAEPAQLEAIETIHEIRLK